MLYRLSLLLKKMIVGECAWIVGPLIVSLSKMIVGNDGWIIQCPEHIHAPRESCSPIVSQQIHGGIF